MGRLGHPHVVRIGPGELFVAGVIAPAALVAGGLVPGPSGGANEAPLPPPTDAPWVHAFPE
jgi:hypothetical protein